MAVCRFSAEKLVVEHSYPPRFGNSQYSTCKGDMIQFKDCNEDIPGDMKSEKSVILLRTGHTRYHPTYQSKWYICTKHRKMYGTGFAWALAQKKCIYPKCLNNFSKAHTVTFDQAKAYIEKDKKIIPYGARVCAKCNIHLIDYAKTHKAEEAARDFLAATNSNEDMDTGEEAPGPKKKKPGLI